MFALRIYIAALDLLLLAAVLATRALGMAEVIVITFPLLYLILEMREELSELNLPDAPPPDPTV
jgi:hypothetical protein